MGVMIFANNATSRLKAATPAASLTIALAPGDGAKFPTIVGGSGDWFMVTGDDRRTGQLEIMKCTARAGDILTVVRGQENTTAQAFLAGALLSHRMTAGTLDYFIGVVHGPEADAKFINADGDTMTGPLALRAANPTGATEATHKGYVDGRDALKANLAGGNTLTGLQALDTPPTHPTPSPGDNTTKSASTAFVQAAVVAFAATLGALYARLSGGNAFAGLNTFDTTPTHPTATAGDATTKSATTAFVGSAVATGDALKVSKSGDTMTGPLALPAPNPTGATEASHKGYVDGRDALKANLAGGNNFTGLSTFDTSPTAPTPAPTTNTTQLATTAFVATAIASGGLDLSPYQLRSEKGAVLGYAGLDSFGKVPVAQLPALTVYQLVSEKGGLNGYASLDSSGKVPAGQLNLTAVMPLTGGTFSGAVNFGTTFTLPKPAGSALAGPVLFDTNVNSVRIYENGGSFRGVTLDLTACGAQSTLYHSGNFNPSAYSPLAGPGSSVAFTTGDITALRAAAPTTGVIFLGNSGGRYLFYDGTKYVLQTASLEVGGNITAFASDARLKKNVRPICKSALAAVKKLRGVRFEWDEDGPQPMRGTEVGVISQEVQEVLPEAVTLAPFDRAPMTGRSISGHDYQTIQGGQQLIALLIEAVNEMQERIDLLEATV